MRGDPRRLAAWAGRVRETPATLDDLAQRVDDLLDRIRHLDDLAQRSHHLVVTDGDRIQELRGTVERLAHGSDDGPATARALADIAASLDDVHAALLAPARDRATRDLVASSTSERPLERGVTLLVDATADTRIDEDALGALVEPWPAERVVVLCPEGAAIPAGIDALHTPLALGHSRSRAVLAAACRTRHAMFAAPGDRIDVRAVRTLSDIAERWSAAVVHAAGSGPAKHPGALTGGVRSLEALRNADPRDDDLAVIDVEAARTTLTHDLVATGGEVQNLSARVGERGGLLVFVPVVIGVRAGASTTPVPLPPKPPGEIQPSAPPFEDRALALAVIHPETGPLWASTAAVELDPRLVDTLPTQSFAAHMPEAPHTTPLPESVLVVSAGGTRNLVHDADTATTIRRLRRLVPPDVAIEVVSEGSRPGAGWEPAVWLASRRELAARLLPRHRAVVIVGGELSSRARRSVAGRAMISRVARGSGSSVLAIGVSVGPFENERDADQTRELLSMLQGVSVSDASSASAARALGIDDVAQLGCATTVDHGSAWPDLPSSGHLVFQPFTDRPADGDPRLPRAIVARPRIDDTVRAWGAAVDEHAGRTGSEVVALAIGADEVGALMQLAESSRRSPWRVVDATDSAELAWTALDRSTGVVAASTHVRSWARQLERPVLTLDGEAAPPTDLAGALAPPPSQGTSDDPAAAQDDWLAGHLGVLGLRAPT